MTLPTPLEQAEAGYTGYAEATGGKTFDGRDMPAWQDLPEHTVQAWTTAAGAIRSELPEVRVLRLQPGDELVLAVDHALDDSEAEDMNELLHALFPDHRTRVVSGGELTVVRKDGE
ncbi:MAG TPA: hypothetical protein VHX38_18940 [Pseudonocardiaceae bacterium]|jgi:hypothetical protein|nr:hypothetical protein [Pseudonocardiaceae bacterium]